MATIATTTRRPRRRPRRTTTTATNLAGAGAGQPDACAHLWGAEATLQQAQARAEPFGYACQRCLQCCRHKAIQVNPYEIARLAAGLGVSTSEFRNGWTQDGARLARREDGTCVFLGPEGCTVHADRPLVCRIYPLGRHVSADGEERWSHVEPHPLTRGIYSQQGAIADYLEDQGALPFMRATDAYAAWLRRAMDVLQALDTDDGAAETPDLLDMDGMIAADCQLRVQAEPIDIEARMALHLALLDDWLRAAQETKA